jgi:hypothetical protein
MGEVPVMGAVLGGVVLLGAPLTVLVFLAMPVDVAAPMVGWTAFVAVVVAVVAALVSRSRGGAAYPIEHASGWSNSHVRRHERGHVNVARALGCYARVDIERGETYVADGHLPPVPPTSSPRPRARRSPSRGVADREAVRMNDAAHSRINRNGPMIMLIAAAIVLVGVLTGGRARRYERERRELIEALARS